MKDFALSLVHENVAAEMEGYSFSIIDQGLIFIAQMTTINFIQFYQNVLLRIELFILFFLFEICQQIQKEHLKLIYIIKEVTKLFAKKILSQFTEITNSRAELDQLSQTCEKLFKYFSEEQTLEIEKKSLQILSQSMYDIIGVEISCVNLNVAQNISLLGSGRGLTGNAMGLVGSVAVENIALGLATGGLGVAVVGLVSAIYGCNKLKNQNQEISQNLEKLKSSLHVQLNGMCEKYSDSLTQTMFCIKKITNGLIDHKK